MGLSRHRDARSRRAESRRRMLEEQEPRQRRCNQTARNLFDETEDDLPELMEGQVIRKRLDDESLWDQ